MRYLPKSPTERQFYRASLDTRDPNNVDRITQEDGLHGITMSPDAFRHWRERKAYTLDTAAQALGLSRRMVAYYEQDAKPIPRVVALAVRALELS